jgi:hypothetical protein
MKEASNPYQNLKSYKTREREREGMIYTSRLEDGCVLLAWLGWTSSTGSMGLQKPISLRSLIEKYALTSET